MQSASFWNKRSFFRILCALNFDGGISISISCNTFSLAQFGNIFALHACIQVKLRPKTKKTMPNQQLQTRMGMARTNANLQSILQKRTFPCSHVHTFPNTNTTTSLRQITKHTNKKNSKLRPITCSPVQTFSDTSTRTKHTKKKQNFDQLPGTARHEENLVSCGTRRTRTLPRESSNVPKGCRIAKVQLETNQVLPSVGALIQQHGKTYRRNIPKKRSKTLQKCKNIAKYK